MIFETTNIDEARNLKDEALHTCGNLFQICQTMNSNVTRMVEGVSACLHTETHKNLVRNKLHLGAGHIGNSLEQDSELYFQNNYNLLRSARI